MGYEGACEKSWAAEVADSNLERGAKWVCLLFSLRLTAMGTVELGSRDDWLGDIARQAGMTPAQVDARIKKAQEAGWLTVARFRDSEGAFSIRQIRATRPRMDGTGDRQLFVSTSAQTLEQDVRDALRTDTKERNLQRVMSWE